MIKSTKQSGTAPLHFAGTIRCVLERAETTLRGSALLAHVAFAGAITGIVGITMAIVMIGAATSVGAAAEPLVSRAVSTASAGPYLVAAMGFAALLGASGLLTLQTGALRAVDRDSGTYWLRGISRHFHDPPRGDRPRQPGRVRFLPGILALAIWSIATSVATHRGN